MMTTTMGMMMTRRTRMMMKMNDDLLRYRYLASGDGWGKAYVHMMRCKNLLQITHPLTIDSYARGGPGAQEPRGASTNIAKDIPTASLVIG